MAKAERQTPPPYVTYKSFFNLVNGFREGASLPSHLTRSIFPGSNSGKATMALTLKAMNLIDEGDKPTGAMKALASSHNEYGKELNKLIRSTYPFLSDPDFALESTTTDKLVEKFRASGVSGSTVSKCIAFFLSACKDAEIEVSKYVKVPATDKSSAPKKVRKKNKPIQEDPKLDPPSSDMVRIPVPLHGHEDGLILLPKNMSKDEWGYALKIATFLLENYRPSFASDDEDEDEDEDGEH